MKKITAVLLILATVLSLSACKINSAGNDETTAYSPDEYQSRLAEANAEESERVAESLKAKAENEENMSDYISEKIGKTKKKTKLVVNFNYPLGDQYLVFEFDKKGNFKTKTTYFFIDSIQSYYSIMEAENAEDGKKIVDKDKDMQMFAVKDSKFEGGRSFDDMYAAYTNELIKESGYTVIE